MFLLTKSTQMSFETYLSESWIINVNAKKYKIHSRTMCSTTLWTIHKGELTWLVKSIMSWKHTEIGLVCSQPQGYQLTFCLSKVAPLIRQVICLSYMTRSQRRARRLYAPADRHDNDIKSSVRGKIRGGPVTDVVRSLVRTGTATDVARSQVRRLENANKLSTMTKLILKLH